MLADRGGCGGKVRACHVDYAGLKGIATKVEDKNSIPMCNDHHMTQHRWGWATFEANFGFSPGDAKLAAEAYWKAWPGRVAWEGRQDG